MIPVWLKWLAAMVAILIALVVLAYAIIVGPLFYACQFDGNCV